MLALSACQAGSAVPVAQPQLELKPCTISGVALSDLQTAVVLPRMLHSAAQGDWSDVLAAAAAPPPPTARRAGSSWA
jgi:hypothetical protein